MKIKIRWRAGEATVTVKGKGPDARRLGDAFIASAKDGRQNMPHVVLREAGYGAPPVIKDLDIETKRPALPKKRAKIKTDERR